MSILSGVNKARDVKNFSRWKVDMQLLEGSLTLTQSDFSGIVTASVDVIFGE